jgi:UDP-N-acetylmuramyl pentapeptide phosphotransferase/UDP-N-acetylglucosamine-1-phosphate transferase
VMLGASSGTMPPRTRKEEALSRITPLVCPLIGAIPLGLLAAYRSQSEAEFRFRQLKDSHVVSISLMHHWTDSKIRVHVFTCVLALAVAHLTMAAPMSVAIASPPPRPAMRGATCGYG